MPYNVDPIKTLTEARRKATDAVLESAITYTSEPSQVNFARLDRTVNVYLQSIRQSHTLERE